MTSLSIVISDTESNSSVTCIHDSATHYYAAARFVHTDSRPEEQKLCAQRLQQEHLHVGL